MPEVVPCVQYFRYIMIWRSRKIRWAVVGRLGMAWEEKNRDGQKFTMPGSGQDIKSDDDRIIERRPRRSGLALAVVLVVGSLWGGRIRCPPAQPAGRTWLQQSRHCVARFVLQSSRSVNQNGQKALSFGLYPDCVYSYPKQHSQLLMSKQVVKSFMAQSGLEPQ